MGDTLANDRQAGRDELSVERHRDLGFTARPWLHLCWRTDTRPQITVLHYRGGKIQGPLLFFEERYEIRQQRAVFVRRAGNGGAPIAPLPPGSALTLDVTGVNGVPAAGVSAVILNVTAAEPQTLGHVSVFPCGAPPHTSNLNYVPDVSVPNLVIAPVNPDGTVCFSTNGTTDLVADLSGWFASGSDQHALNPSRLFDTRHGLGGVPDAPLAAGAVLEVDVTGLHGVPASGVGAVILNVTATNHAKAGYIAAFPCGDRPLTSNVNFDPHQTVPNAVLAPISPEGTVCFSGNVSTDLVVDVSGWFTGGPTT